MQDGWLPLKNDRIEYPILPDGLEFRNWNLKQDVEKQFCEVNFFLLKRESEECLNKPLLGIDGLDGNKSAKARTLMRY